MTKTANDLAQDYERTQTTRYAGDQRVDTPRGMAAPQPNRGTLKIYNGLGEDQYVISAWSHAVVEVRDTLLIIRNADGSKDIVYPERGWYVSFEPDDAGE